MLSSDEVGLEDVFNVALEVQDNRAVNAAVLKAKRALGDHKINKSAEKECEELDRILKSKGFRLFHFDRHPLKYFMSPIDLPWSPAEIMLLMDRRIGKPPFNLSPAYSDGGHSLVRTSVIEQVCAVFPSLGIVKLATFPLPRGERGEDEAKMWEGIDYTMALKCKEDVNGEIYSKELLAKEFPKGKPSLRARRYVRDSGGGGWAGLRLHYNKHLPLDQRRKTRVTNEEGECIEEDCDLHVVKAVGNHCKWLEDDFEEDEYNRLTNNWLEALSPLTIMESRKSLFIFIEQQTRKDVEYNLMQLVSFYKREAMRCLHFFSDKGANLTEPLIGREKKVFGGLVTMAECFHVTAASRRGRHFACDTLNELQEAYLKTTPSHLDSRNHRPDTQRHFPKKRRVEVDLTDAAPAIIAAKRNEDGTAWEWLVDSDRNSTAADKEWFTSARVKKELVVEFLGEVHYHSTERLGASFTVAVDGKKEVAHQVVFGYIDASTESGFTVNEVQYLLKEMAAVQITPTPTVQANGNGLKQGQWMVLPGSGRQATCAAKFCQQGCATRKTLARETGKKVEQPVLGARAPRVAVMGKRLVNEVWVETKFQFCLKFACCTRVPAKFMKIAGKPTDLPLHPDVTLTNEEKILSGALTFRE
ncbi:hypothetical protein CYMTET_48189 [Cymbomonas tetramitiformis]|uniref:Uncharacterized protein n=1 Tax=Cymbomonas tetramitiformis TaxID=36881 RepID=A0AAE0BSS7_9CHLO|nr:hypothetical protein CYMTET_48189 [Cymbomonas tetramitiformis]